MTGAEASINTSLILGGSYDILLLTKFVKEHYHQSGKIVFINHYHGSLHKRFTLPQLVFTQIIDYTIYRLVF